MRPFAFLLRHPRRTGFIAFNLVVLALLVAWALAGPRDLEAGVADLPNWVLGHVGMALLLATWVVAWLAWGWMVVSRRRRLRA
jgi:hypothetical protein